MAINGEIVKKDDILHDILYGRGIVVTTNHNSIEVLFDNGRRVTFDQNGYINGTRRLYWHSPIAIDPPKDENRWNQAKKVINSISEFIKTAN